MLKSSTSSFSIPQEISAAVEEDGLLSLFSLSRDADLAPLAEIVHRAAPAALVGHERYLSARDRPGNWPDLMADGLDLIVAEENAGLVLSGGNWHDGLEALLARLGLVLPDGAAEAAMSDAIAGHLLGEGGAVGAALADPRLAGLTVLAEAALQVALLRRTIRKRLGLKPPPVLAQIRSTPPLSAKTASGLLKRLASGADVVWDEVTAIVPGADFARLPPCNIAVAGRSGVGKSTLLNAVFGRDLAATGIGRPVTKDATWYEEAGFAVRLLDTRGLERGGFAESMAALEAKLEEARAQPKSETQVHLLWLCLDGSGSRLEESDRRVVEMARRLDIPVIVVVTKAWFDSALPDILRAELPDPPVRAVVPVIATQRQFGGGVALGPEGLDVLVEKSLEFLPEAERAAMAAVQRVLPEARIASARLAIGQACKAAALVSGSPIPFADTALLAPIQIVMVVAIAKRMGVVLGEDGWKAIAAAVAGPLLASLAGRFASSALGNILKGIPGIGTVVGGSLNAAVAVALTRFLGEGFLAWLTGRLERGAMPTVGEIKDYLGGGWISGKG
jgi:uncharacterized protein (DUF697 family)/GTP-binding protein EngB required for normal cell division